MKPSLIAAAIAAALGLLSMGLLGGLLYYAVYPVVYPMFGNLNDWRGDEVWPATIGAGMLWALSFLPAGLVNRRLVVAGAGRGKRWVCYGAILWVGALLAWLLMATTLAIPFPSA